MAKDDTKTDADTGPPPGQQSDGDGDTTPTMGDLRKVVAEVVETAIKPIKDMASGGSSASSASSSASPAAAPAGQPGDLRAMVAEAVKTVTGDRDRQAADEAHRKQHAAIAAAAERPPVERPRRSRWLGNIWDE